MTFSHLVPVYLACCRKGLAIKGDFRNSPILLSEVNPWTWIEKSAAYGETQRPETRTPTREGRDPGEHDSKLC